MTVHSPWRIASAEIGILLWQLVVLAFPGTCTAADPGKRPTPHFSVVPLPEEYRRPPRLDEWAEDVFYLDPVRMIAGQNCVVSELRHKIPWSDAEQRRGDQVGIDREPVDIHNVGWLAVDVPTGRHTYLTLFEERGDAAYRMVPAFELHGWRTGTCAIGVRFIPKGVKESANGTFPGEETYLWEWKPPESSCRLLGRSVPVTGLAAALIGTDYEITWSDDDASPWNGRLQLTRRGTDRKCVFLMKNDVATRDALGKKVYCCQEFGPTEDKNSIVIAEQYSIGKVSTTDFSISRFDFEKNQKAWKLGRSDLEAIAGGQLASVRVVPGAARPCYDLPVVMIPTKTRAGFQRILWLLSTETGKLRGPYQMRSSYPEATVLFDYEDVLGCWVTSNGKTVANLFSDIWQTPDAVAIYDLQTQEEARRLWVGAVRPWGFLADGHLISSDGRVLQYLVPPYTGEPKVVFRVANGEKK